MKLSQPILALLGLTFLAPLGRAQFSWEDHYTVVSIPAPAGVDNQIGGLDLDAEGRLVACFHRGEVMKYDEVTGKWSLFASGLHEPLGLYVEAAGTILVLQRAELTRLHDRNGDGVADFYETVSNDWGLSGNYHEFAFGLVKDSKQNIYLTLGTASNGSGVREEVRGKWNNTGGLTLDKFLGGGRHGTWSEKKEAVPRMYSRVPYRGCVLRIAPGSSQAQVYATGFRTPNGLYMDANDQLWVTDNQGDWVGASKLHRVVPGGFHGHPASLLWGENPPDMEPSRLPVAQLDALRVKAAGLFPQGDCANSMTQILPYKPSFGPLLTGDQAAEQLITGEMNSSRLIRHLPDVVHGQHQGTGAHLLETESIGMGNNRILYTRDGASLYLGKTHLSWPGREGIKKVTYNGKPFLQVDSVKLTPQGFAFTFNAPIEDPAGLPAYKVESYRIAYHAAYGSQKFELETHACAHVAINGNVLTLQLDQKPRENRVYDIVLPKTLRSKLGEISSTRFWYTAHRVY
ncbi:MAG: hypothetical protein JNK23_23365 [Opitutaceae bacterium]|nr:hypothetical protein [Opitutaceae bacterium]